MDHPAVKEAIRSNRQRPVPLGLYVDGVRYTSQIGARTDSLIGFWLLNLLSGKRHLLCFVRTSDMCKCGCRGWCTLYPILLAISWIFRVLRDGGTDASHNVDFLGQALDDSLIMELSFAAILLYIKGDWAEHAKTLGLGSWAGSFAPCSFCSCMKSELHLSYRQMSCFSLPFLERTKDNYFQAVQRCEVRVEINSEAIRAQILQTGLLSFHRRKTGPSGYVLLRDVENLGLKVGDRSLGGEYTWHAVRNGFETQYSLTIGLVGIF